MLDKNLFEKVLLEPAKRGAVDRLQIVSGYAKPAWVNHHMQKLSLLSLSPPIKIELIVGMTRNNNRLERADHIAFREIVKKRPHGNEFSCHYVDAGTNVHAKTYCWFEGDKPVEAFIGSANYTKTAFSTSQTEAMTRADAQAVSRFYNNIFSRTADCLSSSIENRVNIIETRKFEDVSTTADRVTLALIDKKTGEPPTKAGLNWGQRDNRDRDQAYINIPAHIRNSGFFPDRSEQFAVLTDDDSSLFIMVRAQDGGKGLQTPDSNAELGRYMRDRMGLPSGAYVTRADLDAYGRTDVTFIKIDDETYLLDFHVD